MTSDQLDTILSEEKTPRHITIDMLADRNPRTLLWGYTVERHSWHLFLKDRMFHLLVYRGPNPVAGDVVHQWSKPAINLDADRVVPNKRLYPEACDFEFCRLLKQAGVHLSFTTFNAERPVQQYYGCTDVPEGVRVYRFGIHTGDANHAHFASGWFRDRDVCYRYGEELQDTYDHERDNEMLPERVFFRYESGIDRSGTINIIEEHDSVLERHWGGEEARKAAERIIAHLRQMAG